MSSNPPHLLPTAAIAANVQSQQMALEAKVAATEAHIKMLFGVLNEILQGSTGQLPSTKEEQAARLEPTIEGLHFVCDGLYDLLNEIRIRLAARLDEYKKVAQKREVLVFMKELQRAASTEDSSSTSSSSAPSSSSSSSSSSMAAAAAASSLTAPTTVARQGDEIEAPDLKAAITQLIELARNPLAPLQSLNE